MKRKTRFSTTPRKPLREIVLEALIAIGRPAGTKEILAYIRKRGFPILQGKTPRASIQAAVWKDIAESSTKSAFKMLGTGRKTRKFWLSESEGKNCSAGMTTPACLSGTKQGLLPPNAKSL